MFETAVQEKRTTLLWGIIMGVVAQFRQVRRLRPRALSRLLQESTNLEGWGLGVEVEFIEYV